MGGQSALHMTAKGSIEDPSDIVARANSMQNGQSIYSAAASFESSYVGKSAQKPAEKPQASEGWTPPVGYVPSGRRPASQARPTATDPVTARVNEMLTSGAGAAVAAPQPPTKKWEPYGGYEPKGRQDGASGKKWQPLQHPSPRQRSGSHTVATNPKAGRMVRLARSGSRCSTPAPDKEVGAIRWLRTQRQAGWCVWQEVAAVAAPQPPTKKWEPYGGYEPKGRQDGASG